MISNLINIGKITKPHGIKGHIKLMSFTQIPEDIFNYKNIFDEAHNQYALKFISNIGNNQFICSFNNNNSRNLAEEVAGKDLYILKDQLPKVDDGEIYHHDLIELDLFNEKNELVGKIIAVHNFGAGDIIEVALNESNKTIYLPFDQNYIIEINLDKKILIFNFSTANI